MSTLTIVRRGLAVLALLAASVLAVQVISELNRVQALKTDLAALNDVRYGLLNAQEWVARIAGVLERQITQFQLTESNRPQIRQAIERALDQVLLAVQRYIREQARPRGDSFFDDLGRALAGGIKEWVLDIDGLRTQVPAFADLILEELSRPEARRALKDQLIAFLHQASDSAFSPTDRNRLNALLTRYQCATPVDCSARLEGWIAAAGPPLLSAQLGLYGLVLLIFGLSLLGQPAPGATARGCRIDGFNLTLLTATTLLLLLGGVLTPMIEIDARIADFQMELLNETIRFSNQVLYFQSKSIFDVVSILTQTGAADMIFVAVLLVTFSVLFPLTKVLASFAYYSHPGAARNELVRFFALRSAKWSMADVLVVATFMAYVGFSGLVGNQLGALSRAARPVELLTTNGTVLAGGFFLFVGFVLTSLLLSALLEQCAQPAAIRQGQS